MNKLTALMVAFTVVGSAAVASAKPSVSPQKARAQALKALKARGLSTNVRVHTRGLGYGRGGKEKLVLIENVNSGRVMEGAVSNKRARIMNTKLFNQSTAAAVASGVTRRERNPGKGQFSGVKKQGLSGNTFAGKMKNGGTYVFGNKTDRTEKTYVSVKTGKVMTKQK